GDLAQIGGVSLGDDGVSFGEGDAEPEVAGDGGAARAGGDGDDLGREGAAVGGGDEEEVGGEGDVGGVLSEDHLGVGAGAAEGHVVAEAEAGGHGGVEDGCGGGGLIGPAIDLQIERSGGGGAFKAGGIDDAVV